MRMMGRIDLMSTDMVITDDDAASWTSFDAFLGSWQGFVFLLGKADSKSAGMLLNITEIGMINNNDSYQHKYHV